MKVKYAVSEPEFFGRIPVRTEATVLPADDFMSCPVCSERVSPRHFVRHCDGAGDRLHLAASVLDA